MLISFSVKNFHSFRNLTTLEMSPGKSRSKSEHIRNDCLKTAAVFGPNAGGKSSLIQALGILKKIVTDPYYYGTKPLYYWGSNDYWNTKDHITTFEISIETNGLIYRYKLEVESVSNGAENPSKRVYIYPIRTEELYVTDPRYEPDKNGNIVEKLVFKSPDVNPKDRFDYEQEALIRSSKNLKYRARIQRSKNYCSHHAGETLDNNIQNENKDKLNSSRYKLRKEIREYIRNIPEPKQIRPLDPSNQNEKPAANIEANGHVEAVYDWFKKSLVILDTTDFYLAKGDVGLQTLGSVLQSFDLGITGVGWADMHRPQALQAEDDMSLKDRIDLEKIVGYCSDMDLTASTVRKTKNGIFRFTYDDSGLAKAERLVTFHGSTIMPLYSESDGTVRMIELASILIPTKKDVTFVVDEIDRRLHPLLCRRFMDLYELDPSASKQLIFTTHDTSLLTTELFRKDEIWFVDKEDGVSHLTPLDVIKINNNKRLEWLYLDYKELPGIPKIDDA